MERTERGLLLVEREELEDRRIDLLSQLSEYVGIVSDVSDVIKQWRGAVAINRESCAEVRVPIVDLPAVIEMEKVWQELQANTKRLVEINKLLSKK